MDKKYVMEEFVDDEGNRIRHVKNGPYDTGYNEYWHIARECECENPKGCGPDCVD